MRDSRLAALVTMALGLIMCKPENDSREERIILLRGTVAQSAY